MNYSALICAITLPIIMNQRSLQHDAEHSRLHNQNLLSNRSSNTQPLTFQYSPFISSYKAQSTDRLVNAFKQCFRLTSPTKHHQIRQHIFSNPIMKNTNYLSCETRAVHNHTDYYFVDQYEAVILLSCSTYHPLHIQYVAEEISERGKLECKECKIECLQVKEIAVDALLWGFHEQINHYQGCFLIINKREIGQLVKEKAIKQAQTSRYKTVVIERQGGISKTTIVEVKLLQLARDGSLQLQVQSLSEKIGQARAEAAETYKRSELDNSSVPVLANTVCFYSLVRIRNPLINRLCTPASHNYRVIVFSFENVYFALFAAHTQTEKVFCRFPGCTNYFDKHNFPSNAIVIQEMQSAFYQEETANLTGMYSMRTYIRNWHIQLAQQAVQHRLTNNYQQISFKQRKARLDELLTTANLREAASRTLKLNKKLLKSDCGTQKPDLQSGVCEVSLGQYSMCPVRCIKCCNLDTRDVYLMGEMFESEKRCILCGSDAKKKQFYDVFYIDLQLLQFIYLQGFAQTVNYNLKQKYYFHNIGYFTATSLAQKLLTQNKVLKWGSNMSALQCTETEVAIIDLRCMSKSLPESYVYHVSVLDQKQELIDLKCPRCGISLRVDRLLLCLKQRNATQIEQQLKKYRQYNQAELEIRIPLPNKCHQQTAKSIVQSTDLKLISKKFPNQFAKMLRKKQSPNSMPRGSVGFEGMQTQGNLLLFSYPVGIDTQSVLADQLQNTISILRNECELIID